MAHQASFPELARQVADVVRTVMDEIRPTLVEAALSGKHGERANTRHAGNLLTSHDLRAHDRYRLLMQPLLPAGFVYASEEAEPEVIGDDPDPDLCVLVDPLDTTELAVRALHGYTHVLVYSRSLRRPVTAVVGDIYHHIQLYLAARHDDGLDRASLVTRDGDAHALHCDASTAELNEALVTNYLMRPAQRFAPLAAPSQFTARASREFNSTLLRAGRCRHTGGATLAQPARKRAAGRRVTPDGRIGPMREHADGAWKQMREPFVRVGHASPMCAACRPAMSALQQAHDRLV
jgi:hypothetical protein